MTNPIQLLRDFRKRKETRYERRLEEVIKDISEHFDSNQFYDEQMALYYGILYGIEHRKEKAMVAVLGHPCYYEVTCNKAKQQIYVDKYIKQSNRCHDLN